MSSVRTNATPTASSPLSGAPNALSSASRPRKLRLRLGLVLSHVKEYCLFDSRFAQRLLALLVLAAARLLRIGDRRLRALRLETSVHRSDWSAVASRAVETIVARELAGAGPFPPTIREYLDTLTPCSRTTRFFAEPHRILRTRVLVTKSFQPGEKGIVIIDYSFVFPVLAKFYDLEAIARRYHLVLEPSWSGACDLDVLTYARLGHPVFVQTSEPRDIAFLRRACPTLVPIPIAANWWTDPSLMFPVAGTRRDVDVIMVASWARFKRHGKFFAALRTLRRRGVFLRASLLGYPAEIDRADIMALAHLYGIQDQVELHEWLTPQQVNEQFNRAKVNLIWSRREGFNRAIIEGLFAGVPCILRTGFNYGHHYDYINEHTGCFSTEQALPDTLLRMSEASPAYRTREWALANMSPFRATALLNETIRTISTDRGEPWSRDGVVKIGTLNTMRYHNTQEAAQFEPDYQFLASAMRPSDGV